MQQRERAAVLAVEVQQASGAVCIAPGDLQILRQGDAMREGGVDIPGDSLARVEVQRRAAGDEHPDWQHLPGSGRQGIRNARDELAECLNVFGAGTPVRLHVGVHPQRAAGIARAAEGCD